MGLPMISCSYFVHGMTGFPMNIIHMNRSLYDQLFLYLVMAYLVFLWTAFLYLRSYVCVPIFIHGINGLPISVHRIIGFLMNSLPIIAFLYLRSYDCVFLYPCLPVERGGSILKASWQYDFGSVGADPLQNNKNRRFSILSTILQHSAKFVSKIDIHMRRCEFWASSN